MAAVIKVKRRWDQDPAEALIVHFEGGGDEEGDSFHLNHHECSYRKRSKRSDDIDLLFKQNATADIASSDEHCSSTNRLNEVNPTAANGAKFDYLTTVSERDASFTSSAALARQLKTLLSQHEAEAASGIVKRKLLTAKRTRELADSSSAVFALCSNSTLNDKGERAVEQHTTDITAYGRSNKNPVVQFELGGGSGSLTPPEKPVLDAVGAGQQQDDHSLGCRDGPVYKTYRLKRKFRQLVDADDVDMINICGLTMSPTKTPPSTRALRDESGSNACDEHPVMLFGKRRRSDAVEMHAFGDDHAAVGKLNVIALTSNDDEREPSEKGDGGGEELLRDDFANYGSNNVVDGPSVQPAIPIFLGELEDWDAIYGVGSSDIASIIKTTDSVGLLESAVAVSSDKSMLSDDTVSAASASSSVISSPAATISSLLSRPVEGQQQLDNNNLDGDSKDTAVAGYVYDLYVRRLPTEPVAVVGTSVIQQDALSSGTSSVRATAARLLRTLRRGNLSSQALYDRYCSEEREEEALTMRDANDTDEENYAANIMMELDSRQFPSGGAEWRDSGNASTFLVEETGCFSRQAGRLNNCLSARPTPTALHAAAAGSAANADGNAQTAAAADTGNESLDDDDDDNNFYAHEQQHQSYEDELSRNNDDFLLRYNNNNAEYNNEQNSTFSRGRFLLERDDNVVAAAFNNSVISSRRHRRRRRYYQPPQQQQFFHSRSPHYAVSSSRRNMNSNELLLSVPDEDLLLPSPERRSTLPAIADDGSSCSTVVARSNATNNGILHAARHSCRRFSEVLMNNITRELADDAEDMGTISPTDIIEPFESGSRSLLLQYRMRPILLASRNNDNDLNDFSRQCENTASFSAGPSGNNDGNFISLARFGRSGRRNVMAPTPAPLLAGRETPAPLFNSSVGESAQNYAYYYDNDIDDDDFFAHMSNGEDSPHPLSDTENEEGDDECDEADN